MRDGIRVSTHEELIPYMTGNRHMNCVHAASQLGCLDCIKWMVSKPDRGVTLTILG